MSKPTSVRLLIGAVIGLLAVGATTVWVNSPSSEDVEVDSKVQEDALPFNSSDPELTALSLSREKDNSEVFRRAFWRHPSPSDEILQAERREWSDESEVQRWDWFIAVDASDAFAAHLLKKNPFQLKSIPKVQTFSEVPTWFPETSKLFQMYQSRDGKMIVLFNPKTQRLYAKSSGYGFKAGKPEAQPDSAQPQVQSIGRLPNMAPPTPIQSSE